MNKTYPTVKEALADIKDGAVIGIGGFFAAGASVAEKLLNLDL